MYLNVTNLIKPIAQNHPNTIYISTYPMRFANQVVTANFSYLKTKSEAALWHSQGLVMPQGLVQCSRNIIKLRQYSHGYTKIANIEAF